MASDKVVDWEVGSIDSSGNLALDGTVTADGGFAGDLTGNVTEASLITTEDIEVETLSVSLQMDVTLPEADPLVAGRVWNNSGVMTISTGS